MHFEQVYLDVVRGIIQYGEVRQGRNGKTRAIFGANLFIDVIHDGKFPILTTRRIYGRGVLGELAAFVRGATTVGEFKRWGCNYWTSNAKAWAKNKYVENEALLEVGQVYGAQWVNWERTGYNQLKALITGLKAEPYSRRHVLTSYSPTAEACLPPCHLLAQFYVDNKHYLSCNVYMRSVDMILGLPSDVVLYAALLIAVAREAGYRPSTLNFSLGDAHVYENHIDAFMRQQAPRKPLPLPEYDYIGSTVEEFIPADLQLINYEHKDAISYALSV